MNLQQKKAMSTNDFMEGNNQNSLKEILIKYLAHWRYFSIGLFIAISGAFFYLQITPPSYEINATLVINDRKNSPEDKSVLKELDVSSSATIVENELGVLRSRKLMSSVVNDLQLWIEYHKEDGLKTIDLYSDTPVIFSLIRSSGSLQNNKIEVKIKDNKSFYLKNVDGGLNEFIFGEDIISNFGTWKLEPEALIEEHIGANIIVMLDDPEQVTEKLSKSLEVFLENKLGAIVHLTIQDHTPQRGKDILNNLISTYTNSSLAEKNELTESTLEFINNRLVSISEELSRAETEIEGFRSSQGLTNISSQSQVYLENAQSNDRKLNEVDVQISLIEGIESALDSSKTANLIPATIGIPDPALFSLIEKFTQLKLEKEKLLASTPEKNPVFNPINKQISATENSLREHINSIKHSLINTKKELTSYNYKIASSIKNIPGQERQFLAFSREKTIKEDLYVYLLQKREEVALSYASTLQDTKLIDHAYAGPIKHPKKMFIYALAVMLGFGIPASIIFAKDSLNDSIVKKEEIETATGLSVIAELNLLQYPSRLVFEDNNPTPLKEQLRTLRTKLHFIHGHQEKGRVTLITSSVVSEGKSFVTTNLGLALAASGRKSIILDLDLRKPKIAKYLKLSEKHPGLSDFLAGSATKEEIICDVKLSPNLHVISPGEPVINPAESLEKKKLVQLISDLRETYDDVIIDSPPIHLVADAMIISHLCDATLYVVRQGYTNKSELLFIKELNEEDTFNKINIVFNGIDRKTHGYGYAYDVSYLK